MWKAIVTETEPHSELETYDKQGQLTYKNVTNISGCSQPMAMSWNAKRVTEARKEIKINFPLEMIDAFILNLKIDFISAYVNFADASSFAAFEQQIWL